jgi:hypothetical protein
LPSYEELNQRHPSVDVDATEDLCALYEGGKRFDQRLARFLPKREREHDRRYHVRRAEAEYRNYLGPIIDFFVSMLFASEPVLKAKRGESTEEVQTDDYWTAFREDCNRAGINFAAFFRDQLTEAMVQRCSWFWLRQPTDDKAEPLNRADFDARGLGNVWLETIEACEVLDWETDDAGNLEWAIVHEQTARRSGISGSRSRITETWRYLTAQSVETYAVTYEKDKPPQKTDAIARVSTEPHRFGRVPVVCFELPAALWVANRLRSPQLAHFRKVNAQSWSLSTTCYAMPVAHVQDPEAYEKQISGPGYEIVLQQEDKYTWAAPPGDHFAALDAEIKSEKDEIFRIANQMALGVDNNAAAIGRSAESKTSDYESTRVVLNAFSRATKEVMEYTLDLVSAARGDGLKWSVEGLDDFAALDVDAFLANLALVGKVGNIPSKTFQIQAKTRVAEALLRDIDEPTKQKIRKEIEAGTADPVEERERELEAALATFGPAPGPQRPSNGSPAAKA